MGMHERLGADSPVGMLRDLLYNVFDLARWRTCIFVVHRWGNDYLSPSQISQYDVEQDVWGSPIANMTIPRSYPIIAAVGSRLFVMGGWNERRDCPISGVEAYDPRKNEWANVAVMPTARGDFAAVVSGDRIFTIGGWNGWGPAKTAERYDPASDTWARLKSLPLPITNHAAVTINGRIFNIGGYEDGMPTSVVRCYDIAAGAWGSVAPLPRAIWHHSAAAVGGRIYVTGGCIQYGHSTRDVYCYDAAADKWSSSAPLIKTHYGHTTTAIAGGELIIMGQDATERYDPVAQRGSLLSPAQHFRISGVATMCL
jgi:N-acetylneuraminic acid mutarotase